MGTIPESLALVSPPRRCDGLTRRMFKYPVLMLPAFAVLGVFFVYPLWGLVLRSLDPNGNLSYTHPGFTLANYRAAFGDSTYWIMFRSTVEMALASTVITVLAAYPVAYFIAKAPRRTARALLGLMLFPYLTSILIRLYAFTQILAPLHLLYTTPGAVIGMVDYLLPYMIIMLYAAMTGIDIGLSPAARTLGARPRQVFSRIFFPLSRAGVVAGALFVFVVSLGFYITPAVLGSTTNVALPTYIQQKVNLYEWGVASAMGIALLIITLALFALANRSMNLTTVMAIGSQKGTSRSQQFRWTKENVILAAWTGIAFGFLLLPLAVVILASFTSQSYLSFPPQGFSLRWYHAVFSDPSWFRAGWLSLRIALLTAALSTALGLAAALGLERSRIRGKAAIRTLLYTPLIVPVVLIGASLFGFESQLRITGTVPGYVAGHVIITLPVAMIILTIAIQGTDRTSETAARTLGARPWQAFWRITFPAIAPSAGAAALVCFLISWDEPVISLFLSGITQPLPVKYLLYLQQQLEPTMAAVGTLLMAAVIITYAALVQGTKWSLRAWRWRSQRQEELICDG